MKIREIFYLLSGLAGMVTMGFGQKLGANFGDPDEYLDIPFALPNLRGELPRQVDLSKDFPAPGNQGNQNSCVGWAVAYALKGYQEIKERNWKGQTQQELFSPSFIYNQINNGEDKGSNIAVALDLLMRQGVATLAEFPYAESDYKRQPAGEVRNRAREFAIASFRRLDMTQASMQTRGHLADGFPVVIGMNVGTAFQGHREGIYHRPAADATESGHAMCVVGYDDERRAFRLINSWGTGWGESGYGWVSYETFAAKVVQAFVAQDIVVYRPSPDRPKPPTVPDSFDPIVENSPWIFADSDRRRIRPSELRVRSAEQLWRARNEIYARRGYIFKSERGRAYVNQLGRHYTPRIASSAEVEAQLNATENYNLALIRSFETARPFPVDREVESPWVFADSSARRLDRSELQGLSQDRLWRARNEIFARNGYIFQGERGKKLTASMGAMYGPVSGDMTMIYERLNSIERGNVALISEYEQK